MNYSKFILGTALICIFPILALAEDATFKTESSEQESSGFVPYDTITIIGVKKAKALYDDGVLFIDVRQPAVAGKGRVKDATVYNLLDPKQQDQFQAEVGVDQDVVIYGAREDAEKIYRLVRVIHSWGYEALFFLKDGMEAWQEAGYPVKVDPPPKEE